jgi:hypothetical protein
VLAGTLEDHPLGHRGRGERRRRGLRGPGRGLDGRESREGARGHLPLERRQRLVGGIRLDEGVRLGDDLPLDLEQARQPTGSCGIVEARHVGVLLPFLGHQRAQHRFQPRGLGADRWPCPSSSSGDAGANHIGTG